MMHVDGEILKRCLANRCLEELVHSEDTEEGEKIRAQFRELLEGIHHGNVGKNIPMRTLIDCAYEDLEFFLRPVL